MQKFATSSTFVPGASPQMEGEGFFQEHAKDKKGRYLWNMPEPIGFHETTQIVKKVVEMDGKTRQVKVTEKVAFPVYRGVPSSLARHMRSQYRRAKRKLEEKAALAQKQDAKEMLRDLVLNPGE